jgi:hypothetical protein
LARQSQIDPHERDARCQIERLISATETVLLEKVDV